MFNETSNKCLSIFAKNVISKFCLFHPSFQKFQSSLNVSNTLHYKTRGKQLATVIHSQTCQKILFMRLIKVILNLKKQKSK